MNQIWSFLLICFREAHMKTIKRLQWTIFCNIYTIGCTCSWCLRSYQRIFFYIPPPLRLGTTMKLASFELDLFALSLRSITARHFRPRKRAEQPQKPTMKNDRGRNNPLDAIIFGEGFNGKDGWSRKENGEGRIRQRPMMCQLERFDVTIVLWLQFVASKASEPTLVIFTRCDCMTWNVVTSEVWGVTMYIAITITSCWEKWPQSVNLINLQSE